MIFISLCSVSLLSVADKYGVDTSEGVELLKAGIVSDFSKMRKMAEGRDEPILDDLLKFINPKAILNDLKTALNLLQRNFQSFHKNMNVLLYFHSKGSIIFESALKSYLHSVSSDKHSFTLDVSVKLLILLQKLIYILQLFYYICYYIRTYIIIIIM